MDAEHATEPAATPPSAKAFVPLAASQRIEALDVVRGFALFGIFLMNIEWFNRPFAAFNEGMPSGLTGLDWLASWFVAYFVAGKFWTIFSLLFGMGFAVMLVRAERAGRAFTQVYLRRILALAVFGAVHFIYLWDGDILFSYAVGALGLLIVLYGGPRPIVIACAVLVGLGFIPEADAFYLVAGGLAVMGWLALYLRGERRLTWRGVSMPVACCVLLLAGALMSIAALVLWLLPDGPTEPRLPLSVFGPLLSVVGWLSWKYHEPAAKRSLRMAVSICVFAGVGMTAMGLVQQFTPDPMIAPAAAGSAPVAAATATAKPDVATAASAASSAKPAAEKPKKSGAERAADLKAEREKRLKEQAQSKVEEVKSFTTGTYPDTVGWRGRRFLEKAAGDAGFAVVLVSMFLLGVWFVRSGVMAEPEKHVAFFRKLALYGLPVGTGLGLLTGFIAVSHTPGERYDGWGIARGLLMLGNLPACLGYVGLVVTMLYSHTALSRIRVLAPAGRMALTNYLMQSVICMAVFYGFGLGHWGMPRALQLLFVVVVYAAQVALSHWWLAHFRYGPVEWLWRGFTYRQVPPLRVAAGSLGPGSESRATRTGSARGVEVGAHALQQRAQLFALGRAEPGDRARRAAVPCRCSARCTATRAAVNGTWQAALAYDWPNAHYTEHFVLGGADRTLHGSASFLGVPRGMLEGALEPDTLHIVTRTQETGASGDVVHRYRAKLVGDELHFVMQTEGGSSTHAPVEFVARSASPKPWGASVRRCAMRSAHRPKVQRCGQRTRRTRRRSGRHARPSAATTAPRSRAAPGRCRVRP